MLGIITVSLMNYDSKFRLAISACEKSMMPQRAHGVFERMQQSGIAPTEISYCALISAAEKGAQYKLALRILDEMIHEKNLPYSIVAYSATISALAKGQQWRAALYLFRCLVEPDASVVDRASVPKPNVVTYNATMTALEKSMQWEKALDLFDQMRLNQLPVTVVSCKSYDSILLQETLPHVPLFHVIRRKCNLSV
jgi:pentatricopeptide repeat protein